MPDNRYFIDAPLQNDEELLLEGDEFTHLTRVMRKRLGDQIELVNGKNTLSIATIDSLSKKNAKLTIIKTDQQAPPVKSIILAQGLPLFSKLEYIIEKGTELGASAFWLFPGERSEKKSLTENQRIRLHKLSIAALKQCGRLDLPLIVEKPSLKAWERPEGTLLYGNPNGEKLSPSTLPETTVVFIGPEGGFSPSEVDLLHGFEAKGIRLNSNILRTETAALCALSLLSYS